MSTEEKWTRQGYVILDPQRELWRDTLHATITSARYALLEALGTDGARHADMKVVRATQTTVWEKPS